MKSRVMVGFIGLLIVALVIGDAMARGRGGCGGGRVGGRAGCLKKAVEVMCHRPRVADRPTFVDPGWTGNIHIALGGR